MLENPWSSLAVSTPKTLELRRIDANQPHDFYWGRNSDGHYLLVLRLRQLPKGHIHAPTLRGITVDFFEVEKELRLTLRNCDNWEIFHPLCQDLLRSTYRQKDERNLITTILGRLEQWQKLLSHGIDRLLSESEIRGLLGELLFLKEELLPNFGRTAVTTWQGPDKKPQDFLVRNRLFEIKTYQAGSCPAVVISSPEQLWAEQNPLYLVVYSLSKVTVGGINLPEVVKELTSQLEGTEYLEVLESKLLAARYIHTPAYDEHRYEASRPMYLDVRDGFPRLLRNIVPDGVEKLSYAIRLDSCIPFVIKPDWANWAAEHL